MEFLKQTLIQWRIQDFPEEGAPTYGFTKFSQKLHEIERISTGGGEWALDPPLLFVSAGSPSGQYGLTTGATKISYGLVKSLRWPEFSALLLTNEPNFGNTTQKCAMSNGKRGNVNGCPLNA